MEGQQRANAAQIAARNIKAARGSRRKTPLRSESNPPQTASFQGGGGGGLFGGSVQATGTFDFAAPAGGLSFPPPSFGGNNIFGNNAPSPGVSDGEGDPRADTSGEEDARRKKSFRGPGDSESNAPFQMSNSFGQNQQINPFSSATVQEKPASSIFSFGQSTSQPGSQGINFNSSSTQDKPAGNIFSFGAPSPQPTHPPPTINFGSGSSQDKSGSNIFNFGQPASQPSQQQAPSSGFNFGSTALQDKATSSPFSFGQSSTPPPSSGINFSSAAASTGNIFRSSQPQQPAPSTNPFTSNSQQPAAPTNIFANVNAPNSSSSNMFGNQEQSLNPKLSNLFGGQSQQQPAPSISNIFGNSTQTPAESNPLEEENSEASTPSNNLFGNLNKPREASSSLFFGQKPAPTSNLFGAMDKQAAPTGDLFDNLNKPVDKPAPQPNVNDRAMNVTDGDAKSGAPDSSNTSVFNQTSSTSLFAGSKSLFSAPTPQAESTNIRSSPAFSFGSIQPSATTAETNGNTLFSPMKPIDAPTSASQPPPSGMFPSLPQPAQSPKSIDTSNGAQAPMARTSTAPSSSSNDLATGNRFEKVDYDQLYAEMAAASALTDEEMSLLVPARFSEKQRIEFYTAYRMRSLNKAMEKYFGSVTLGVGVSNILVFYNDKRLEILNRSALTLPGSKRKTADDEHQADENPSKRTRQEGPSNLNLNQSLPKNPAARSPEKVPRIGNQHQPHLNGTGTTKGPALGPPAFSPNPAPLSSPSSKGKRKAESQMTKEDEEREERERRQMKMAYAKGSSAGSNTSNIFKNILDSTAKASPEKVTSLPEAPKDEAPRVNPFGNLPVPKSPTKAASQSAPTTSLFAPKPMSKTASPFSLKPALSTPIATGSNSTEPKPNTIVPPTFGSGTVNFLAQFGQQAKKYEKDNEEKLMEEAKAEDMDSDEDEVEWEAKWKERRRAELKELDDIGKNKRATFMAGKGFAFDRTENESDSASSSMSGAGSEAPTKAADIAQSSTAIKALFGQNTQSSGNSIFGSRTSTPGPFGSSTGSVLDGHTSGQPVSFGQNIFGHLSDVDSGADSGKGADDESADEDSDPDGDSENKDPTYEPDGDNSSGPGTPVEETGLGIASAKKVATSTTPFNFGSSRFGGALGGSSKSGTASPSGSLFDRITKDSNGKPLRHFSTEEKENTQPSTTTNIFGDIGKSPFSNLNKTAGSPADKTWKPDSPIRFGTATPTPSNDATNPTLSVTAATPTKPAASNIFGSSRNSDDAPKPNFSSLFGNFNNSKAASASGPTSAGVGFNFGASSATSSLFPSAAASTTTSAATSPGATTDGDSAAEDPDAEIHEQIDLTSGGPGEEDEDVIHEVRAKAIKFNPKGPGDAGSSWDTKGVGPLRVLKNRETNASRILLRADPSGTIVLNKGLLAKVSYEATGKTIKLLTAGEEGKSLETWILQVKSPELAEALASVLELNKLS